MNEQLISGSVPTVDGIVTRSSPFTVKETVERVKQGLQDHHLTLFATIDHGREAKRVGLAMQAAQVLIFGNPKGGTPLMRISPLLALELPLRCLIWQSEDNRVWVNSTSVAYLQNRFGLPRELAGNLKIIDAVIEEALNIISG